MHGGNGRKKRQKRNVATGAREKGGVWSSLSWSNKSNKCASSVSIYLCLERRESKELLPCSRLKDNWGDVSYRDFGAGVELCGSGLTLKHERAVDPGRAPWCDSRRDTSSSTCLHGLASPFIHSPTYPFLILIPHPCDNDTHPLFSDLNKRTAPRQQNVSSLPRDGTHGRACAPLQDCPPVPHLGCSVARMNA